MKRPALALCSVLALPGCSFVADDDAVSTAYGTGTLVVDWTIDGATNPAECRQSSASSISIAVSTERGRFVGEFPQDCEAFTIAIELEPGDYEAEAVLLDVHGDERTTPVEIPPFSIFGDDVLHVPVGFPSDSFF